MLDVSKLSFSYERTKAKKFVQARREPKILTASLALGPVMQVDLFKKKALINLSPCCHTVPRYCVVQDDQAYFMEYWEHQAYLHSLAPAYRQKYSALWQCSSCSRELHELVPPTDQVRLDSHEGVLVVADWLQPFTDILDAQLSSALVTPFFEELYTASQNALHNGFTEKQIYLDISKKDSKIIASVSNLL